MRGQLEAVTEGTDFQLGDVRAARGLRVTSSDSTYCGKLSFCLHAPEVASTSDGPPEFLLSSPGPL